MDSRSQLEPLGEMIGDCPIVTLTEAVHFTAEPLEFRNKLFRYLVERKGFTAIAIESGLVEGRLVHDYVRCGTGEIDNVLQQGISWTFNCLPQNRALVQWMRSYNADPLHERKISFYGFDVVPASGVNDPANRSIDTALQSTLRYLMNVDAGAGEVFQARLAPLLAKMQTECAKPAHVSGYDKLSSTERNALTALIFDLITLFERREGPYAAASSVTDYAWALRAVVVARQADAWLRNTPVGWKPGDDSQEFGDPARFLFIGRDLRDRAQADNLEWILSQQESSGKTLIFGHRNHLSTAPVSVHDQSTGEARERQVAGTYLRRRVGKRMVTIGNLIGQGELRAPDVHLKLDRAPVDSMDGLAGEAGPRDYLLDLRTAPDAVARWLSEEQSFAHLRTSRMVVKEAFDVLLYTDQVTPALADGAACVAKAS